MVSDAFSQDSTDGHEVHTHGSQDLSLSHVLSSGASALVLTTVDGFIRRVSAPAPRNLFPVGRLLRGQHITAPFVEDERGFVEELLKKVGDSGLFSMSSIPVRLNGSAGRPVFLGVTTLTGAKTGSLLIAWRFSPTLQDTVPDQDDRERRLVQRVEMLESRLRTQRQSAEHSRKLLDSLRSTNQTLSRALAASRDLRRQQGEAFRQTIQEKDVLIQRARELHASANAARRNAEQSRDRLAYLAEMSWALAESLDIDATLQQIVERIVPMMADCCMVALLDEERDILAQVAATCASHAVCEGIHKYHEHDFRSMPRAHPIRHAMLSGHPAVVHDLENIDSGTAGDDVFKHAAELGLTACIVAPLRSRDRVFGTLTIASTRPGHRFLPEDLQFVEDIALRAAQALDNALLFSEVQEAAKDRERYLSIASHELRSPLAIVSGFGSLLLRFVESPELDREKIATISEEMQRGIERLEMLTSNLLTSASISAHGSGVDFNRVDLAELLQDLVDRMNTVFGTDGVVRLKLDAPCSLRGWWNADGIERAIENILSNALKYSDPDSLVHIELSEVDEQAVITVRDQGIGMTRGEVEDLFTPFARGQTARQTAIGTGLGLYITQQVVHQHGGRIDVESTLGVGSVFTIYLPFAPPSASPADSGDDVQNQLDEPA